MSEPNINLAEAPYDNTGSLLHYPTHSATWLPNDPFHATLQIDRMKRGYSAKYVFLKAPNSSDGREYPMFVADLVDMVARATISNGIISGRWKARKRGANYGLAYLGEA